LFTVPSVRITAEIENKNPFIPSFTAILRIQNRKKISKDVYEIKFFITLLSQFL